MTMNQANDYSPNFYAYLIATQGAIIHSHYSNGWIDDWMVGISKKFVNLEERVTLNYRS